MRTNYLLKKILSQAKHVISLAAGIKISQQKLLLPFYHVVSNHDLPHIAELYPIRNTNTFKEDLKFFTTHYTAITMQELNEQVKNQQSFNKPSFHLTFDDGLKEMLTVVAPILKEQGIPATFFINSAFVDNKDLFYRYKASLLIHHLKKHPPSAILEKEMLEVLASAGIQQSNLRDRLLAVTYAHRNILDRMAALIQYDFAAYLNTHQPYLTTEDIFKLKEMGFTIGAHSIDHPEYQYISLQEQLRQTKESMLFLKKAFDLPYAYFSFPFSDENVSKAFFEEIFSSTDSVADLSFGISGLKKDSFPRHLHRFPMEGNQQSAEALIKTEYLYYIAKSLIKKNHIIRR